MSDDLEPPTTETQWVTVEGELRRFVYESTTIEEDERGRVTETAIFVEDPP